MATGKVLGSAPDRLHGLMDRRYIVPVSEPTRRRIFCRSSYLVASLQIQFRPAQCILSSFSASLSHSFGCSVYLGSAVCISFYILPYVLLLAFFSRSVFSLLSRSGSRISYYPVRMESPTHTMLLAARGSGHSTSFRSFFEAHKVMIIVASILIPLQILAVCFYFKHRRTKRAATALLEDRVARLEEGMLRLLTTERIRPRQRGKQESQSTLSSIDSSEPQLQLQKSQQPQQPQQDITEYYPGVPRLSRIDEWI
ncbi:hypothetical protein PVAG01_10106 [Phlyctema vagabunda]|uniref:Uncharacterized protein n=1 Tax=Phlyctema vagabunda TaxID=108571 RepID=A0ABR4P515_9HELO